MENSAWIGFFFLVIAVVIAVTGHDTIALLVFPLYATWITVHKIEMKINALLNDKAFL